MSRQSTKLSIITIIEYLKIYIQVGYQKSCFNLAVVNFFFKSPTIVQFSNQATMTWIDFLSNMGGILGLFIGFRLVDFWSIS